MSWQDEPTGGCEVLYCAAGSHKTYGFLGLFLLIRVNQEKKLRMKTYYVRSPFPQQRKPSDSKPQARLKFFANFDFDKVKTAINLSQ